MIEASARYLASPTEADRRRLIGYADEATHEAADIAEYDRFVAVARRQLPARSPNGTFRGVRVLVTGGTGTVGRALMEQLQAGGAAQILSLSRGQSPYLPLLGVRYENADVRDPDALRPLFDRFRPDAVFHLAAIRSPKEAELTPATAIQTNVLGTVNVIKASRDANVETFVYASTGKAVRLYTEDIYAATKKAGEWIVAAAAAEMKTAATRFTHVVDNSIIHAKLRHDMRAGIMSLHAPNMVMHAQSAIESGQLLIEAALYARVQATAVLSLRGLEWPFELTQLALGLRARARRSIPLVFEGYESGYESQHYPGLYDGQVGDTGPLINRFEAKRTVPMLSNSVNSFMHSQVAVTPELRELVQSTRATFNERRLVSHLHEFSKAALSARLLSEVPADVIAALKAASRHESLTRDHSITSRLLRDSLKGSDLAM